MRVIVLVLGLVLSALFSACGSQLHPDDVRAVGQTGTGVAVSETGQDLGGTTTSGEGGSSAAGDVDTSGGTGGGSTSTSGGSTSTSSETRALTCLFSPPRTSSSSWAAGAAATHSVLPWSRAVRKALIRAA